MSEARGRTSEGGAVNRNWFVDSQNPEAGYSEIADIFDGLALGPEGWHAYFLHGFHLVAEREEDVAAVADYGGAVTAIVARGNVAGTQFHPEKSQKLGLKLIANFLEWKP